MQYRPAALQSALTFLRLAQSVSARVADSVRDHGRIGQAKSALGVYGGGLERSSRNIGALKTKD